MNMRRSRVWLTVTASFVCTCALVSAQGTKSGSQTKPQEKPQTKPQEVKSKYPSFIVGTGKCAGQACHGSLEPVKGKSIQLNEFTTWMNNDKHRKAYQVLKSARSKTIAKNLAKLDGRDTPLKPAHEDARCLACHAVPGVTQRGYEELAKANRLADGVSCESCHGAAEKWIELHTQTSWRDKSAEQKKSLGMNDTESFAGRAKVCAGCHVGTPADEKKATVPRDAFHDIMAAGHPPLNFEFSNFHGTLKDRGAQHWIEKDRSSDCEARVWFAGQVVVAQTALELLESRANAAAADKAPWPEFAEYDCSACHHDLDEPSWPQQRGYRARRPGALPWGTSNLTMLKFVLATQGAAGKSLVEQLDALEKLMTEPYPDRKKVAAAAREAAAALGKWWSAAAPSSHSPQDLDRLMKDWINVACDDKRKDLLDRDAALQLYFALVAFNESVGNAGVRASLAALYYNLDKLQRDYNPMKFREELQKLQQQLGQ